MSVYLQPKNPVGNLLKLEFPYTPQIEYGVDVKYDSFNLTHTNYQPYAYTRTENPSLSMSCKFSAHTTDHFNQSVNAIRFLRTYTKMNYGRQDPDRGLPPRILRFFAYGPQLFNDVPVVISKFNITFPEDIDYVSGVFDQGGALKGPIQKRDPAVATNTAPNSSESSLYTDPMGTTDGESIMWAARQPKNNTRPSSVTTPQQQQQEQIGMPQDGAAASYDKTIWLPVLFQVHITLLVQQNLSRTVNEFNLHDFAQGDLVSKGYI